MSPTTPTLRLGTRGSALARWQADHVAARLAALGAVVEIEIIKTSGDADQVSDFGSMGAKGIFVKEIEDALLERRIDLAVHSLKDLPTELPEGLALSATLERESPRDGLVSRDGLSLAELPPGAVVATGSLRRSAQILALRRDIKIVPLRGNVPTRVRKIREGEADATLLAVAGLHRLGLSNALTEAFSPDEVTPPMGQGALAIETRAGELADLMAALDHAPTRRAVEAERAFIARIGGGCKTPAGVLAASAGGGEWLVIGMIASADGASLLRRSARVDDDDDLSAAAARLAEEMIAQADKAILATLRLTEG